MRRCVARAGPLRGLLAVALAATSALLVPVSSAPAAKRAHRRHPSLPGADCQPYSSVGCLLPFPDDRLTREDLSTPTGLRVQLPAPAMPMNRSGERIAVGEYDRADGFSPGSTLIVHVPGLDNAAAFARAGAAALGELPAAQGAGQPVVLVDESSARRQLIWSELDATAPSRQDADLLIHPARGLLPGHTYAVALRDLRAASGELLAAPGWFARLRDKRALVPRERSQQVRYRRIFAVLSRAHIARRGLYEAWDFTVSSTVSLTSRLLAIRDNAFAQLGDFDLADGVAQGRAPAYSVTSEDQLAPGLRRVQGTFAVPCYLLSCEAGAEAGFHYPSLDPDAVPAQPAASAATAAFDCVVPTSSAAPARAALYGHGFLGTRGEVESAWVQQLAVEHNIAFCATDWLGLAAPDLAFLIQSLRDVNELPVTVDRIQQGILNTLYLGRLMLSPQGFAANPAFASGGRALIDDSHLYFYGNSLGAILGGVLTAVEPDLDRAVLDVGGSDFFNLMVPRGSNFSVFGKFVLRNYRDASLHPLVLDLLQQIWERADPDGYAREMTVRPPPHTPPHEVLMQIAYGDFQVSMYAAAYEARSIGASAYQPALEGARARDQQLLFGLPAIGSLPFAGSAIELWDSGAGRTQPPPLQDLPPPPEGAGDADPHEDPRYTPAAQQQISDFLQSGGAVSDVCGSLACRTTVYVP